MENRYHSISTFLRTRFEGRVFKIALESGLGCPHRDGSVGRGGCSFCSLETLRPSTSWKLSTIQPIPVQIEAGLKYLQGRHQAQRAIAHFGNASNTHADPERLRTLFEAAIRHPSIVGLAISTRPDCLDEGCVELLHELSQQTFLWVELGLQSAHNATLARIHRGHTVEQFTASCERLMRAHIPVCAHVILGLPGETPEMMHATTSFLSHIPVWGVKFHNLHVLKGTRLYDEWCAGAVEVPTLERYAGWVVDALERLHPSMVVHRVSGHGPKRLTVAPAWSINHLAIMNAVHAELLRRDTWQGKCFA